MPATVAALQGAPQARAFFDAAGVLITGAPVRTTATVVAACQMPKNVIRIAYRQSEPWRFRLEASTETKPDPAKLTLLSEHLADVIAPGTATHYVPFESSAFAQRKLAITFDDRGRPTRLERTGTSAGAAIALAVSDASRAARDEYATSLAKLVEVQTSQQKLQLGSITAQIDDLKKRKELLDARLAVEGASANFDTILQQQQLQAELSLLQATQAQASAAGSAEQRLEIESLKLQLEQLKAQIDILKAQQELALLRK